MTITGKRYLYHKLVKSVALFALLFATGISIIFFITEFERASKKTETMIDQLLDTVESTAAIAVYANNNTIAEDVLKGLLRNDIIHEARLSNTQDLQLTKKRDTKVPQQADIVRPLHSPFGDAEVIGYLTVVPEAQYNLQEARHGVLINALSSCLLIGVTALIVLSMVRSYITHPLMSVSTALHAIKLERQEYLELPPRNHDDELGQLVMDINALLKTLQAKFVTEHTLREQLETIEYRLRTIFEMTSAGIFLLDDAGKLLTTNPTLRRVIKLPHLRTEELQGQYFAELAFAEPEQLYELMRSITTLNQSEAQDLCLKKRGDAPDTWVHCLLSRQTDSVGSILFEGVVYDISDRIAAEASTRREADYDALTGLLRRQAAERQLIKLLNRRRDAENVPVLLLLDLDHFKEVNDTYGHDAGDRVLVEAAAQFKNCVRSSDIVARLGGDEFLIVLVNCSSPEYAQQVARNIVVAISKPIQISSTASVQIGVSIGLAIEDGQVQSLEKCYKAADQAMYEVKHQGRNGFAMILADGTIMVENL